MPDDEMPSWFREHAPPASSGDIPSWFKEHAPKEPTWGERLAGWGKQAVQSATEFAGGAAAGLMEPIVRGADVLWQAGGHPSALQDPSIRKAMAPDSTAGKAGYMAGQAAPYFLPIGPEIEGAGLVRGALRAGKEALKSGAIGGAQTGTWRGAGESAALGAGGEVLGAGMRKLAPKVYEHALRPAKKFSLPVREEMAERGLEKTGLRTGLKSAFPKLEEEISLNKARINELTKDPASPYSQRSIDIDDVLRPVDRYIERVSRIDKRMGAQLSRRRLEWAKELGYDPGSPAHQVATGLVDHQGNPIMRQVPATPAKTTTTVAKAQELKETFSEAIPESAYREGAGEATQTKGRKLAQRGMRRSIETAIPEEPIREINHVIENDLRIKEAITDALKRNSGWIGPTATFVLGEGTVVGLLSQLDLKKHPEAYSATLIPALALAAVRSPAAAARLAVMLKRTGVVMPKLVPAGGAAARGSETPETPQKGAALTSPGGIRRTLTAAAERHQLPPALLHAVAQTESSGRTGAVSPKGAVGLMQLMPTTARQYGVRDIGNVAENIEGSARLLRHLWTKYRGNVALVAAAYNAGEGAVDRHGGVPPFKETRDYVARVMNAMRRPAA